MLSAVWPGGQGTSEKSTVTITAVASTGVVVPELQAAIAVINGLPDLAFKNPKQRNALTDKVNAQEHP